MSDDDRHRQKFPAIVASPNAPRSPGPLAFDREDLPAVVRRDGMDRLLDDVIASGRQAIPTVIAPTCAEFQAAIDGPAILAELGANADHGAVTVTVLPADGGYVVNVRAVAVVTAERAAGLVAGAKAMEVSRARAVAAMSAPEAITDAMGDGMPLGTRK